MTRATIEQLIDDFSFLSDWEDRYRYVIELGQQLPEFPDALKVEANKVRGCASQVWMTTRLEGGTGGDQRLVFAGDSDAHIVRGLIAVLFALYSGRTPEEILQTDSAEVFARLGLLEHLTPQRSNGLVAMNARIRAEAEARLAAPTAV